MGTYIDREQALSHPFANGKYDHEHANEHFILGFESYREWLEQLPTIDLVRCGECMFYNGHEEYCEIDHFARENGFCSDGKRRIDYTVFTVNPPKGIETPLRGDATVFHQRTQK